jgi:hypothetical protein
MVAAALLLTGAYGCGGKPHRPAPTRSATTSAPAAKPAPEPPALGLTEDNASLLWSPDGPSPAPPAFQSARTQLTALHPTYLRLLVDWAALQPQAGRPPALEAPVSGCARQVGPCGAYAGIGGELAAIASQQRATGGGFRVVLDIFGTPEWAAQPGSGCETPGTAAFSRPLVRRRSPPTAR